ncbi:MAG TPA: DUF1538 domain-containing protein [Mollicutes bacterium]|nr:DUF1538 domain-containing protein [Mollicutes bacterium]
MNVKSVVIDVIKSVLPITIVMFLLQLFLIDFTLDNFSIFMFGTLITILGFTLFLIGVENSLITLGELVGKKLIEKTKIWFILSFCIVLGFAVTIAEPGVQLLANQFASISKGAIVNKYLFVIVISLGIGIYLGLAAIRFIYKVSLKKILIFSYILIFVLALVSPKEFLAVAFDAGGATTGPTSVPFILSLGIGMASIKGTKQEAHESFGFVGLASVGPVLAVLILGVLFR